MAVVEVAAVTGAYERVTSLAELFARSGKVIVCCPEGFWRRGNVEVVCARFGLPLVESLVDMIESVRRKTQR